MVCEDVLDQAAAWRADGEHVAIATVVETWGSAPVPVGSRMVFTRSGKMAGSVSGGCVEAAVIDAAARSFEGGEAQVLTFGVTNERAWEVGLACGGELRVLLEGVR